MYIYIRRFMYVYICAYMCIYICAYYAHLHMYIFSMIDHEISYYTYVCMYSYFILLNKNQESSFSILCIWCILIISYRIIVDKKLSNMYYFNDNRLLRKQPIVS